MDKHNRIPRNWSRILAKSLIRTNAGIPGDVFEIRRGEYGYGLIETNQRTGKSFQGFLSHLRNGNSFEIIEIA